MLSLSKLSATIPTAPPAGYLRGMYVSCGNELIIELNRNEDSYDSLKPELTPKLSKLIKYCTTNFINYIAVYSLGKRLDTISGDPIIGNWKYFDATKRFLQVMHDDGVDVGIVITNKDFLETLANDGTFRTSPFFWETPELPWDTTCSMLARYNPTNTIRTITAPPDSLYNPSLSCEDLGCYSTFELSELLKQTMRVLQYSYWVRDSTIANGCATCTSRSNTTETAVDSSKYLFDYMSLEFEYWDSSTFVLSTPTGSMTQRKASWNNFFQVSQAMVFVYGLMCNQIKMELELRLVPPFGNDFNNRSQPTNTGDLQAEDMLPTSMQVEYLSRAFNRVLVSNYRKGEYSDVHYPKMINKTGNAHIKFSDYPNDINADEYHQFMPLFSAATAGEYKQCFDTLRYSNTAPNDTLEWDEDFFGPGLAAGRTMNYYEQKYIDQLDSSLIDNLQFDKCSEYFSASPALETIKTDREHVVGFMWFNYSTLSDTFRIPSQYNRYQNSGSSNNSNAYIYYNNQSNLLSIHFSDEIVTETSKLEVFTMQGSKLLSIDVNSTKRHFDLSNFADGIYLCRLNNGNQISIKKISILK